MIKRIQNTLLICFVLLFSSAFSQSISGNLKRLVNQEIKLEGFNGLKTYLISSTKIDANGNFKLSYSKVDYGVGYLMSSDEKPLFVILSGEDIDIVGEALSYKETIKIIKGQENKWFEQYAQEHQRREQALSAWVYLEKIYTLDSLFSVQKTPVQAIQNEKQRIRNEDAAFLAKLPKDSYVSWFLPTRKLVSSVSTIAQYRTEEIPSTIAAFRKIDYTDQRLYKSGLFKDAIESSFWLLENSGRSLDSVFIEMKLSIDAMMVNLIKDNNKFNEVTNYLFDLLEKHSLFQASEYLALKVLNESSCTIDSDLAKQLESYRVMKKGNTAPNIDFGSSSYLNGKKQNVFGGLTNFTTAYTLVVFGASWCPNCQTEYPILLNKYKNLKEKFDVEVVYISIDTDKNRASDFYKDAPFVVFCDAKGWDTKSAKDYHIFATPTYILLDKDLKIVAKIQSPEHLEAWLESNKLATTSK